MAEGATVYRWERTRELMEKVKLHDEVTFARILRDRDGLGDTPIGMGNEKAVNQLIAHHSVIFRPGQLKMWISTFPYQLGTYLCYDLNRVFADTTGVSDQLYTDDHSIAEDPFLSSESYRKFELYKYETDRLKAMIENKQPGGADEKMLADYLELNPAYYYPYFLVGEIHRLKGNKQRAEELYNESLAREIPRLVDREQVTEAKKRLMK